MRLRPGIRACLLLLLAALPSRAQTSGKAAPAKPPVIKTAQPIPQSGPTRIIIDRPKDLPPPKVQGIDLDPREVEEVRTPPPQTVVRNFVPEPVFDHVLEQQIRAIGNIYHCKVALYAWQLNTSKAAAVDADQPIQTATAAKLALFWETLRQIALGNTTWDEPLNGADSPTVQDSAFRLLVSDDPIPATTLSSRFTTKRVDEDMIHLGYTASMQAASQISRGRSGAHISSPSANGITPLITPRQLTGLMQHIGMCDLDLPKQLHVNLARGDAACRASSGMLRNQYLRTTAPDALTRTTAGNTRSDVAILGGRTGPIAFTIHVYDSTNPKDADTALNSITRAIVNAWTPAGLDTRSFDKPHLGVDWQ